MRISKSKLKEIILEEYQKLKEEEEELTEEEELEEDTKSRLEEQ
jgi:hypothetical protein